MKKKILCLAMTILMVAGSIVNVSAEDFVGSKDWVVNFTGSKMESNFKSAEMTEEILQIQPGDTITLQVNVKNSGSMKTDWYMTNEVIQTLEESQSVAEGGAYTYILTYVDPSGAETVLYSSDVVGGEESIDLEGEGLHQATNALEDYFFLDRLSSGQSGYVQLVVKLDGETQGNDYQDTLARLKMQFAVEKVEEATTTTVIKKVVKTGDNSQVILFSVVTLISGLVLLLIVFLSLKKRDYKKGE